MDVTLRVSGGRFFPRRQGWSVRIHAELDGVARATAARPLGRGDPEWREDLRWSGVAGRTGHVAVAVVASIGSEV